jgi:HAE1 family hydrophobic/amphiphilic exporter-1
MRSISGPGQSIVLLAFDLRRNIDVAAQDVREKVAPRSEPPATPRRHIIAKFDNDQAPVLTSRWRHQPLRELTELADKVVKVQLERSYGVGEALVGGLNRAINIGEADRLAAYQLPITAVREALIRQNADMPGGNVTAGLRESSLRTLGRVVDPRSFDDVVIATVNGAPIRVRDVGRAEDGTAEQRSVARLNGVPSVILEVRRQSGERWRPRGGKQARPPRPPDAVQRASGDASVPLHLRRLHEIQVHLTGLADPPSWCACSCGAGNLPSSRRAIPCSVIRRWETG